MPDLEHDKPEHDFQLLAFEIWNCNFVLFWAERVVYMSTDDKPRIRDSRGCDWLFFRNVLFIIINLEFFFTLLIVLKFWNVRWFFELSIYKKRVKYFLFHWKTSIRFCIFVL